MTAYKYIGAGAFMTEVPPKNITAGELKEHPEWADMIEANLLTPTPIYQKVEPRKKAGKDKAE